MVGGQNSLKISAPFPLIKIHQMIPLSAKFISLDSTFNVTPIHIIQFLLKNPVRVFYLLIIFTNNFDNFVSLNTIFKSLHYVMQFSPMLVLYLKCIKMF